MNSFVPAGDVVNRRRKEHNCLLAGNHFERTAREANFPVSPLELSFTTCARDEKELILLGAAECEDSESMQFLISFTLESEDIAAESKKQISLGQFTMQEVFSTSGNLSLHTPLQLHIID